MPIDNFYNTEQKKLFLDCICSDNVKNTYKEIFTKTAELEIILDKDLCMFGYIDFQNFFSNQNLNLITLDLYKSFIKKYLRFCNEKKLCNELSEIAISKTDFSKQSSSANKNWNCYFKDIDDYLDFMEFVYEEKSIAFSCMPIVAYGLILIGIVPNDVFEVRREDILNYNKENGIVYNGEKIFIPERLLEYCLVAAKVDGCVMKTGLTKYANTQYLIRKKSTKRDNDAPVRYPYFNRKEKYVKERVECYFGNNVSWGGKILKPNYLYDNYFFFKWKDKYKDSIKEKNIIEEMSCSYFTAQYKKMQYLSWLEIYYPS